MLDMPEGMDKIDNMSLQSDSAKSYIDSEENKQYDMVQKKFVDNKKSLDQDKEQALAEGKDEAGGGISDSKSATMTDNEIRRVKENYENDFRSLYKDYINDNKSATFPIY